MFELKKIIGLFLFKVDPEPDLLTGSGLNVPAGSATTPQHCPQPHISKAKLF